MRVKDVQVIGINAFVTVKNSLQIPRPLKSSKYKSVINGTFRNGSLSFLT